MFHLIGMILFGLIVGVVAKFIMPGHDSGGILVTAILGMVGSILGTFLGRMFFSTENYAAGWIMSIVGTLLVLTVWHFVSKGWSNSSLKS